MSEVKCSTCKGVGRLEFEQGQRRVPCVTCSGSGVDWRKTCDAQRLRADTAEAELKREKEFHAVNVSESERMLAATEQRIAKLETVLRSAVEWFDDGVGRSLDEFRMIQEMRAALNPNPEAESHETN